MTSFDEQLASARQIEMAVGAWLIRRGWSVLPVYDYSGLADGKAPKLDNGAGGIVTPDLLASKAGETRWVEVKFKARADWTHLTQRLETGINLRLWNHYKTILAETGIDVWLVFVHEAEDLVCGQNMTWLSQRAREYTGKKMGRDGMVFFPLGELKVFCRMSDIVHFHPTSTPTPAYLAPTSTTA